jgi:hypothetical protein
MDVTLVPESDGKVAIIPAPTPMENKVPRGREDFRHPAKIQLPSFGPHGRIGAGRHLMRIYLAEVVPMKRSLFSLLTVALVIGWIGSASADYVMIKIDLNKFFPAAKLTPVNPGDPQNPMGEERPGSGAGGPYGGYGQNPFGGQMQQPYPPGQYPPKNPYPMPMPNEGGEKVYEQFPPLWAYAYIEIKGKATPIAASQLMPFNLYRLDTKWGKSLMIPADLVTVIALSPAAKRFDEKYKLDMKDNKNPERLLVLAEWALERGLLNEFHKVIDELKTVDPKSPIVEAVGRIRDDMKKSPQQYDQAATALMSDLKKENYREFRGDHYTLLTNVDRKKDAEAAVRRRLARMEETYQSYFYWFAVKGKVRPQPTHRLVAVLVDTQANTKEFDIHHVGYNNVPMLADGFTARRDNIVLFASNRQDPAYGSLSRNNQNLWNQHKMTPSELLTDVSVWKRNPTLYQMIPWLQTTTLLQHAMDDESELATVTHECVRQLTAATSMLPRTVATAEWAQFGIASFFETPHQAFYAGVGAPNWTQLISFKYLRKTKKLGGATPKEVLLNVVSDRYFQQAYHSFHNNQQIKEEKETLDEKTRHELELARCTSWSLTYYLAQHKLDNLLKYFDELSNLPRDLEYNEKVLEACFVRAFGDKLDQLATAWFSAMEQTSLEMAEVEQEGLRSRLERPTIRPPTGPRPLPGAGGEEGRPYYPPVRPGVKGERY